MTTYLLYAKAGHEFDVASDLSEIGAKPWVARILVGQSRGKRRTPRWTEQTWLSNYLWATMTPEQYYAARDIKFLARTMLAMRPGDMRELSKFRAEVEAEYAKQDAARQSGKCAAEFTEGQRLRIFQGHMADSVVTFRRLIERPHALYPTLEVETEMMGRAVRTEVDPLNVRKEG